jgi:monoamine oxidase
MTNPVNEFSRRGLLRGAAGLAVAGTGAGVLATGTANASSPRSSTSTSSRSVDVVVVGAGLAGLTTAMLLHESGVSVEVLEARDRVGGRTYNHELGDGNHGDMGGTWIGPTQDQIAALAKKMGVHAFTQPDKGSQVYYDGTQRITYKDTSPLGTAPPDPTVEPDIIAIVEEIDQMATTVPVDRPWTAPNAQAWDSQTLATWLKQNTKNPKTMKVASAAFEALLGCEAEEISLLFAVAYVAQATDGSTPGTFERLIDTRGGAQAKRFVQGSQEISIRMAQRLGFRVTLQAPVRRIEQHGSGVTVIADGHVVHGKRVVVAVPPTLAGRIIYSPQLPPHRDALTQRLPQGCLIKAEAYYPKPFWREEGLTGATVSTVGPAKTTFDVSPKDGSIGGLLGFVGGDAARAYTGKPHKLREAVLRNFATYLDDKRALKPDRFVVKDWTTEEWTRGCPVAIAGPGLLTQYGPAISAPVGRIHWAGTETASYWHGYMDGAVRSGERAAGEVKNQL